MDGPVLNLVSGEEIGYYPTSFPYGDSRRDAILKAQAEQLAREMAPPATTLDDLNELMRTMLKTALERRLNTAMDVPLGRRALPAVAEGTTPVAAATAFVEEAAPPPKHRRNGPSSKTVRGDRRDIPLRTPRDRHGTFAPPLIGKHQRRLSGFDEKILALSAKGMTTRAIQDLVREL